VESPRYGVWRVWRNLVPRNPVAPVIKSISLPILT
jgi:hypothetical protein